jgi:hypothetical protein
LTLAGFDGLLWLIATVVPFMVVQRWVHREIQKVFLLITHSPNATVVIFSLILLPGVFLHELSHFIVAKILRVPTGRFTLIPRMENGSTLVMGSVEVAKVDFFRDTLIGSAPLISGGTVLALLGVYKLGLSQLPSLFSSGQTDLFLTVLADLPSLPDFWLWFYIAFAVSATMMPSPSDRGGFAACAGVVVFLLLVAILMGVGPWMLAHVAPQVNQAFRALGGMFAIAFVVNLLVGLPVFALARGISKLTGYQVR